MAERVYAEVLDELENKVRLLEKEVVQKDRYISFLTRLIERQSDNSKHATRLEGKTQ